MPSPQSCPKKQEALDFLALCHNELGWDQAKLSIRQTAARDAFDDNQPWQPSFEELEHGARVAWRNNARCIGRLFWSSLEIRDKRNLREPEAVAADLIEHIRLATNNGKIKPLVSIYAPEDQHGPSLRIWNHQLFGYAGYGKQAPGKNPLLHGSSFLDSDSYLKIEVITVFVPSRRQACGGGEPIEI